MLLWILWVSLANWSNIRKKSGFPKWLSGEESACNAGASGDDGLIPGLGGFPGGGQGDPLQYSCLENPMDRGVWGATLYGFAKSPTWLKRLSMHAWRHDSVCTHTHLFYCPLIYFISSFKRCWRGPTKTKLITWKMCSGKWGACLPWMMELSYVSAWILSLRGNEGEERAFATLGFTPTSQGSFWVFLTNEQITPKASSQSPFLALFPDVCCTGQRAGE